MRVVCFDSLCNYLQQNVVGSSSCPQCPSHSHFVVLPALSPGRGRVEEKKQKVFTELFGEISYPRDIPVLAGLKKIPQRIIVRYGNRLHPEAPSSSHTSWLSPSLFVCLYPKHPRGVCMLKNPSRSKKLLATNSSHSGSAAAALSPLTSWAAAAPAGSRAAANQRQAALATPFSFATSTPLPLTQPTLISTNAVHDSLQSPFLTFSSTL